MLKAKGLLAVEAGGFVVGAEGVVGSAEGVVSRLCSLKQAVQ